MRSWKNATRIVVAVAFVFVTAAALPPSAQSIPSEGGAIVKEWLVTPASVTRTEEYGDCLDQPDKVCMELCVVSGPDEGPTGAFSCQYPS